jgi:tetratricopeptide (TPR) repeat protein
MATGLLASTAALAQAAPDDAQLTQGCFGEKTTPDQLLQSCSAILSAKRAPANVLASASYNIGNYYRDSKKDYDRAITYYDAAIDRNPNHGGAWFNRAIMYHYKKDTTNAISGYTQAIKLTPLNSSIHYNRGVAYKETRDYDRALADFDQALQLDPANQRYIDVRASVLKLKGQ